MFQCNNGSRLKEYFADYGSDSQEKGISKKRSPGKRPYSIINGKFNGDHAHVTMAGCVCVKVMFKCLYYNLLR
ncbi:MAG: hypothetical protein M1476_02170 [Candidatus Thermoplasmatota archaeon]|nr:hypothetical protein [Candidatus Thermoplasmatota archaeon]